MKSETYYTYIIRCTDNSLYTGITNHLERRMKEHFFHKKQSAKYTKTHTAQKVEIIWKSKNKSLACKLEYHIKTLNKSQKEKLITTGKILSYLSTKIDSNQYQKVTLEEVLDPYFIKNQISS